MLRPCGATLSISQMHYGCGYNINKKSYSKLKLSNRYESTGAQVHTRLRSP